MVYIKISYHNFDKLNESRNLFLNCEKSELTDELVREKAIKCGIVIPDLGEEYVSFSVLATGEKADTAWEAYEAYRQALIKMRLVGFDFDNYGGYTYKG